MGIAPAVRHPQVKAPGRVTALHVRLDAQGGIDALHVLPPERMAQLWTFRDGKQNAFPFVQMKAPLLEPDATLGEAEPAAVRAALEARVGENENRWSSPFTANLIVRCEERRDAVAGIDAASACVPAVLERGVMAMRDDAFPERLAEAILAHESKGLLGTDGLKIAKTALVGKAKGKSMEGIALYFDVDSSFGSSTTDVVDGRSAHADNVAVALSTSSGGATRGICGLTGETTALHEGRFPDPKLPVVGEAYIYARNTKDLPASRRYGVQSDPYPISERFPPELSGTLEAVADDRKRGVTWRPIPPERERKVGGRKTDDLLLATVEVGPDVALADWLAGGATVTEDEAAEAEADVALVIDMFEAKLATLEPGDEPPQATLLLLRKIDPGNIKAVMSRRLSAQALLEAARIWQEAQANSPPVTLRVRTKKGTKTHRPYLPAPFQLPSVTRTTYLRRGTERAPKPAPGMRPQDALALFLGDPGARRLAAGALSTILRRQGGLLIETAHALHRGATSAAGEARNADDFNRDALRAVGAVGTLLHCMDRNVEATMTQNAYRLGQLFAAADAVHAGYCMDVRSGAMPPTLLGNEVLGVAQRDAVRGLDLMARRIRPYQAWSRRQPKPEPYKEGESPRAMLLRKAFWAARTMERLSREIDRGSLNQVTGDVARAEMILGYLAGSPAEKRKDEKEHDE